MKIDRDQFIQSLVEQKTTSQFPYLDEMKNIYQQAFAGYPWYANLTCIRSINQPKFVIFFLNLS